MAVVRGVDLAEQVENGVVGDFLHLGAGGVGLEEGMPVGEDAAVVVGPARRRVVGGGGLGLWSEPAGGRGEGVAQDLARGCVGKWRAGAVWYGGGLIWGERNEGNIGAAGERKG
jgi:hypothetical protein